MHPNCEAVNAILEAAGLPGRVQMLDEAVSTARAAADYLGCAVGAIANSLIFATDGGGPLLIMTSGAHRVDMIKVGAELGVELRRAAPDSYAHIPVSRLAGSLQWDIRNPFARWLIARWLTSISSGSLVACRTPSFP